jgi:hypothetical protein
MTQKEQLVGAWKFLSMTARKPDGEVIHPYGEDLYGLLVYTASGHMSFLGMRRDRVGAEFPSAHIRANARFAPTRKCFALPFIPSHQGRENPVPSPSMERFWERRVQVKRENSQKWRNVTGRKSGEITKER